jgi:hypothetical protein
MAGIKDLIDSSSPKSNNSSSSEVVRRLPGIFVLPLWLVSYFKEFYKDYGSVRFFSGIALALFFAYYFQTKIISPFISVKTSPTTHNP